MSLAPTRGSGLDAVTVRPDRRLAGTVTVDGSKNAALPLLAAAASFRESVHLSNVPASSDVQTMLTLLQQCGYRIAHPVAEPSSVIIMPTSGAVGVPDLTDAARIRASYYLVPPLLASFGHAVLPWPGGCRVGNRGMDLHFIVYEAFGDTVLLDDAGYRVLAGSGRDRVALTLPYRSRGATIAALCRAVASGTNLQLGNPNLSPETRRVLDALSTAGWAVLASKEQIALDPPRGTPRGTLAWSVPGDKIEAGTLACAIAATGGEGRIEGADSADLEVLARLLDGAGIPVSLAADTLTVLPANAASSRPMRAIASLDPDGLDADFEPALMALALTLSGIHLFSDAINPGRHGNLIPQFRRLGAVIEELSPTQCRLAGPQRLSGAVVKSTDIRTGSALLIASLNARGSTTIGGLEQLRRGHADLLGKLRSLGADITTVPR